MLRIEDTDQERYVEGATEIIYRTLEKTGLVHDEGPDKDGGYGPYVQSERMKTGIYMKYAKELIDKGEAYYCFCDKERLASLKTEVVDGKEITVYDKHCLSLSKEEIEANLAAGKPFVIRQNNPKEGTTTFHDELYGDITVDNSQLDDMILIKSDGYPTYNFANVVDDHTMNITHVVRGNEYLSSSPKYVRLYEAFGWQVPVYIHLPLITDENHKKLSKRSGHASFEDLIDQGFITEAIVNYVALLGWSPEDNREIFSLDELIKEFDYHRISKSPAVFDIVKLRWMNGCYIRALPFAEFHALACKEYDKFITRSINREELSKVLQPRVETLNDIAETAGFIETLPAYGEELFNNKKMKTDPEIAKKSLQLALPALESLSADGWNNESLFECLKAVAAANGLKNGQVLYPVRIALTGLETTPGGASEIAAVLGREETLRRIKLAL